MKQSISIVIPTYNNEKTIKFVLLEAVAVASILTDDYEILVIDDCSSDSTPRLVAEMGKSNSNIRLISHSENMGFGSTIKDLYRKATKDLIFSCPADGQVPPGQLFKMVPAIKDFDIVIGYRKKRMDSFNRKIQTSIYNSLIRRMYSLHVSDINSVKLFKRSVLDGMNLVSTSPFVEAEFCVKAVGKGCKIGEVIIEHLPRRFDKNHGGQPRVIIDTFFDVFRLRNNIRRFYESRIQG